MRLLLLDLDDTLLQDLPVSRRVLEELGKELGLRGFFQAVKEEAERLFEASPIYSWATRMGHSALEALWARYSTFGFEKAAEWAWPFREEVFRRALDRLGGPAEKAKDLAWAFFEARRVYPLFPEVPEFLRRTEGIPRVLLTNGVPDLQREKLQGAGLWEAFDLFLISGEVGMAKPEPALFRMALAAFEVRPEEAWMIGDNPEKDILGANRAGVYAVWVDRRERPLHPGARPDRVVYSLLEAL
ncbi:MAG: HAD family hydrolase [Thermaceae bacterium]